MERHFLHDSNKISDFSLIKYHPENVSRQILGKFANGSKLLVNFLPPAILRAPEEDYLSPQPHFTIKSNPIYIVKTGNINIHYSAGAHRFIVYSLALTTSNFIFYTTDVALYESSSFSCVNLKSDAKGAIGTILWAEESNGLDSTKTR
jgi:hypothetical protein